MIKSLLHIGYVKSGSTFLQRWFQSHPQLLYVKKGIAGFAETHAISTLAVRSARTPAYYVTSDENLCAGWMMPLHWTGHYKQFEGYGLDVKQFQRRVCVILKDLFPTAHVLVVTRGYKSILRSSFSQYVKAGGTLDYQEYLRTFREAIVEGLDVDYLLELYAGAFGEENLTVLPYEVLRDDQDRFLELVEKRLGLEHFEFDPGRANPSFTPQELYWYPRISRWVEFAAQKFNGRYGAKAYRGYLNRVLNKERLRPALRLLELSNNGKLTDDDCPADLLQEFQGKAERLRSNPLFAPYATEYLWEDDSVSIHHKSS